MEIKVLTWEQLNIDDWQDGNVPIEGFTPLEAEPGFPETDSSFSDESDDWDDWDDWGENYQENENDWETQAYSYFQELIRDTDQALSWYQARIDLPILNWEDFADESCSGLTPLEGFTRNLVAEHLLTHKVLSKGCEPLN